MEWHPDLETEREIQDFTQDMIARLPYVLGIDEMIPGCEVIALDPEGAGAVFPRYIQVRINQYYQNVLWRGGIALTVGDEVTVAHFRKGDVYEVIGMGGSGETETPLESLADYARGHIIRGGATDWEAYDASGDAQLLLGDGTDINSVSMSGDVEITNAGVAKVTAIQDYDVQDHAPEDGEALIWDAGDSRYEPGIAGVSSWPLFDEDDIALYIPFTHHEYRDDTTPRQSILSTRRDRLPLINTGPYYDDRSPLHFAPSLWKDRRALWLEESGYNYIDNPRFYDGDGDGKADNWTAITDNCTGSPTYSILDHPEHIMGWIQRFTYAGQVGDAGQTIRGQHRTGAGTFAPGDDATFSVNLRGSVTGCQAIVIVRFEDAANAILAQQIAFPTPTPTWKRITVTAENAPATTDHVIVYFRVWQIDNGDELDVYWSQAQLEKADHATTFMHGDLGDGYYWDTYNTPDNSPSNRRLATIDLSGYTDYLINGNSEFSIRSVVRMPYDHDGNWAHADPKVWSIRNSATGGRIQLAYDTGNEWFELQCPTGAMILQSSAQTWDAGAWLDIVITYDTANDEYAMYINGVQEDTDTTALALSSGFDQWRVGEYAGGGATVNGLFAEYTVYDIALTASQVRQQHMLGPTADPGATVQDRVEPAATWGAITVNYSTTYGPLTSWQEGNTGYRIIANGQYHHVPAYIEYTMSGVALSGTDGAVKLQYYDPANAGWVDIEESEVTIAAGSGTDRQVVKVWLPAWEAEYRIMTKGDGTDSANVYRAELRWSPGYNEGT